MLGNVLDADGPAVVENALHSQAFQPEAAGWLWQIAYKTEDTAGLSRSRQNTSLGLSRVTSNALLALNAAQNDFDKAWEAQAAQRHLLFTDWCRTLHLETDASGSSVTKVFPNGATNSNDDVQLANVAAVALTQTAAAVNAASNGTEVMSPMQTYLAAEMLYLSYAAAAKAISEEPNASVLYLRRQPGTRYWRPNDPVVMLTEQGAGDLTVFPPDWLPFQTIDGREYLMLSPITTRLNTAFLPSGELGYEPGCAERRCDRRHLCKCLHRDRDTELAAIVAAMGGEFLTPTRALVPSRRRHRTAARSQSKTMTQLSSPRILCRTPPAST